MSTSRVKTLVIAALALINILFLAVIIRDSYADARIDRLAIENVCDVLRSCGITIDPDNVKAGGAIRTMRTSRDDEAEAAIAGAVLGPTDMTDQGGGIYRYNNEKGGVAEFYSAGDFSIRADDGVVIRSGGALRSVQALIKDMKLEAVILDVTGSQGSETVKAVSVYRGTSIFNCAIEFQFRDGKLRTIIGRYVTGISPAEDGSVISQAGTALLGFLSATMDNDREDIECTIIYKVEAGYQHSVVGSFGEGVIDPAWLITTDTGRYIIDDTNGEIRALL